MRIALGIVTLSEHGGLQRDCLALASALRARGHEVEIFAARCVAPWTAADEVRMLPNRAPTNHGRDVAFANAFANVVRARFDLVVGFNKMSGLDVYYCADPCLLARPASLWRRLSPRRRARLALERACFEPASSTSALMLTPESLERYRGAWRTPDDHLFLLPSRIAPERAKPDLRTETFRRDRRAALGYGDRDILWLWVATQPFTKGLDRVLAALSDHPEARLLVVGPSSGDKRTRRYIHLGNRLGVAEKVYWLGRRDDIPEIMAAADILVHPARLDVTGQVILEALVNGLPVVASEICGFSHHLKTAAAGVVLAEPFDERSLSAALTLAANSKCRQLWSDAALDYVRRHDFARGLDAAADIVERIGLMRADFKPLSENAAPAQETAG